MTCRTRVAAPLLLSLALIASSPRSTAAEVWRRPLWVERGLPIVDVWVGGRGPYRFLVDTGAEGTTVSRDLAKELALPILGAVEHHTLNGVVKLALVQVTALRLGSQGPVVADLSAAVSDLRGPRAVVHDLDGVLGADALGGHDYLLDYTAGRLTLARGEVLPTRGGVALPLRLDRHRPLVSWPVATLDGSLLLVLDSGADSLVVDASASAFTCRRRTRAMATLETQTTRRDVETCELDSLRAGEVTVEGLRLVQVAWPTSLTRIERGLLPASAFGRIYVSPSRGTVTFWAR